MKQLLCILQTILVSMHDTGDSVHAEVFTCACIYVFSRLSQCLCVLVFMYSPDYHCVSAWKGTGDSVHAEVFMYMFACVHGSLVV